MFLLELQQATRQLVEKEVATRKEEFEEELLEIERKMTANLDRSRNGPRGDIRDRLDTSKVDTVFQTEHAFQCHNLHLLAEWKT